PPSLASLLRNHVEESTQQKLPRMHVRVERSDRRTGSIGAGQPRCRQPRAGGFWVPNVAGCEGAIR
ncbi:MAG TPA: hypothetical protein DIW77_22990, partial [Chromatiaceae bacterium]|nr:hypothetical protein [Chromatiaceae bacterium]